MQRYTVTTLDGGERIVTERVRSVRSVALGMWIGAGGREELAERSKALIEKGYEFPPSETPWQDIQRTLVEQLSDGMVLRTAVKYRRVAQSSIPRDSH